MRAGDLIALNKVKLLVILIHKVSKVKRRCDVCRVAYEYKVKQMLSVMGCGLV